MRLSIRHEINLNFGRATPSILGLLRLTPWAIECQHLDNWRIDVDCDCRLRRGDDAYGNVVDTLSAEAPMEKVKIVAEGTVVTTDTAGILRNALERFPPEFYLRDTECTAADESLREFATKAVRGEQDALARLHVLLVAVCNTMKVEASDKPAPTAIEAFREERGTARDLAHVFIAAARHIGAPARFVNGYLMPDMFPESADAAHAWAEGYVPGNGWIGFDPLHGLCTHEGHVRVSLALDHVGAAFVRGTLAHDGVETVKSRVIACEDCGIRNKQVRSFGLSQDQFQR